MDEIVGNRRVMHIMRGRRSSREQRQTVSSWQTLILIAKMRRRSPAMSFPGAAVGTQTKCVRLDALVC